MPSPRSLGSSSVSVHPFCLGGNVFGWTIDEPTSFAILDAYLAGGLNFVDTADVYSKWKPGNAGGESETIIGKWFASRKNRDKVILATKVGMELAPDKKGLSRKWIMQAVEDSLKRLQTDYIDLYQSHKDDETTPLEETLGAFDELLKAGKVRVIGASNYVRNRLKDAIDVSIKQKLPQYQMLQPHYNLMDRADFEGTLQSVCKLYNIGVIPYYSLASGFLTGKYRSAADLSKSPRGKSVEKYLTPRGFAVLKALDEISATHNSTPAKVALAWLMAQPTIVAPIASATSVEQLKEITDAVNLTLTAAELDQLAVVSAT